ncbi:enoyl-CoA hydratase/isomerase family protein [Streptomyces sp. HSG2]|uniref:enoyl-CoA hydratase/isomerase family protein n=1 Tax=Streptomyces sp. HSG2 TaxID=2797167 RepID=UPI0019089588|nr:enoyl-CoA hydratase/isomerase family protein [Streptomyces sp. HSG2]
MPGRSSLEHIGWDPTPGDVEGTRELSRKLDLLAAELERAIAELERVECGNWKGENATAFTGHVANDLIPLVRKSHESFQKAALALRRWSFQLQGFQDEADRLNQAARQAFELRREAKSETGSSGGVEIDPDAPTVRSVTGDVRDLENRYHSAARHIGRELNQAADLAPNEPGFWESLGEGIANTWESAGDWLREHADQFKEIGDVLGNITAGLAFLTIVTLPFPPLAAVFATATLIGAGLTLGAHGLAKANGADVSWTTLGLDALGLLPGIGLFGKGAKVVGLARAETAASRLGKGFTTSRISDGARITVSLGDESTRIIGGFGKPGLVKIGGRSEEVFRVANPSSPLMSRMGGIAVSGYYSGQFIGTKGANIVPGIQIDPFSIGGRTLDGGMKIAPKIVQHIVDRRA